MKKQVYLNSASALDLLRNLIYEKHNFCVKKTNYSTIIELPSGEKYLCMDEKSGKKYFFAMNKLLSEIKKNQIEIDEVNRNNIFYYGVSEHLSKKKIKWQLISDVYNIDIKSAYASVLKKYGFISEDFFNNEVSKWDKPTRLKAVGSLATNKIIYHYQEGMCISVHAEKNDYTRNLFFLCCHEIGQLLNRISNNCPSFLFYWVDGIYFSKESDAKKIIRELRKEGYFYSFDRIDWMQIKDSEKRIKLNFEKDGKIKKFTLPKINSEINDFFKNQKIKP